VRIIPSLRIIPIAVEERRFSAAMRQEKIRALAPARTRASECGMGRDFVSESSGVNAGKSEAAGSPVPALRKMREGRGTHFVVVSADSKTRSTRPLTGAGFRTPLTECRPILGGMSVMAISLKFPVEGRMSVMIPDFSTTDKFPPHFCSCRVPFPCQL